MEHCFRRTSTKDTSVLYSKTPPIVGVVCEQSIIRHHPHQSLQFLWSFDPPKLLIQTGLSYSSPSNQWSNQILTIWLSPSLQIKICLNWGHIWTMSVQALEALDLILTPGIILSTHPYLDLMTWTHKLFGLIIKTQANFIIQARFNSLALQDPRSPSFFGLQILF